VFEVNNSKDKLAILKSDLKKLIANPLDISLSEKACSDAWHIADWVFEEQKNIIKIKKINLEKDFSKNVQR